MRCPKDVDFDLTNADLWAAVALRAGVMFPLPWVRVLVDCFGAIPAGAWVSLPDGRRGLVLGEAPASATLVLVDGVPTSISSGLRLLSATEVRW